MSLADTDPICTVIGRTRHGMLLAEMAEAAKLGVGLMEIRLDFLRRHPTSSASSPTSPAP